MAIGKNEVARLRITGEDVWVLDLAENGIAEVRRPVVGRDGVMHLVEYFSLAELETPDDYRTRELAERIAMQQKVMQSGGSKAQKVPDELFEMQ